MVIPEQELLIALLMLPVDIQLQELMLPLVPRKHVQSLQPKLLVMHLVLVLLLKDVIGKLLVL